MKRRIIDGTAKLILNSMSIGSALLISLAPLPTYKAYSNGLSTFEDRYMGTGFPLTCLATGGFLYRSQKILREEMQRIN